MAMERSQTPVEMNVRRRVVQASPSASSQFVDESGSGDTFSVAVVHVQCAGDDTPRLLAEATFTHEPYDDWDALCLIAFDEGDW